MSVLADLGLNEFLSRNLKLVALEFVVPHLLHLDANQARSCGTEVSTIFNDHGRKHSTCQAYPNPLANADCHGSGLLLSG